MELGGLLQTITVKPYTLFLRLSCASASGKDRTGRTARYCQGKRQLRLHREALCSRQSRHRASARALGTEYCYGGESRTTDRV